MRDAALKDGCFKNPAGNRMIIRKESISDSFSLSGKKKNNSVLVSGHERKRDDHRFLGYKSCLEKW